MVRFLSHLYELSGELEEQQNKEKETGEILRTLRKGFEVQQRLLRAMLVRKKVQDQLIRMLRSRFIEKQKSVLEPYGFTELDELDDNDDYNDVGDVGDNKNNENNNNNRNNNSHNNNHNNNETIEMNETHHEHETIEMNETHHEHETIDSTEPKGTGVSISMNETPDLTPQESSDHSSSHHRGLLDQLPSLESIRSNLHESEATAAIKFAEYQSACQAIQEFHSQIDSVADEVSLLKRQFFASKQSKPDETLEVAKENRSNVVAARVDRAVHRVGSEPFGNALRTIADQRRRDPADLHGVLCLGSFIADDAAETDFVCGAFGGSSAFHRIEMKNRDLFWKERRRLRGFLVERSVPNET